MKNFYDTYNVLWCVVTLLAAGVLQMSCSQTKPSRSTARLSEIRGTADMHAEEDLREYVVAMQKLVDETVKIMPESPTGVGCHLNQNVEKIVIEVYPMADSMTTKESGFHNWQTRIFGEVSDHLFSMKYEKGSPSMEKQLNQRCEQESTKSSCHDTRSKTLAMSIKFSDDLVITKEVSKSERVFDSSEPYRIVITKDEVAALASKKVRDLKFFDMKWDIFYTTQLTEPAPPTDGTETKQPAQLADGTETKEPVNAEKPLELRSFRPLVSRQGTDKDYSDDVVVGDNLAKYPVVNHISILVNDFPYHLWYRKVGKLWRSRVYFSLRNEELAKQAPSSGKQAQGVYFFSHTKQQKDSPYLSSVFSHRLADFHMELSEAYKPHKKHCESSGTSQ